VTFGTFPFLSFPILFFPFYCATSGGGTGGQEAAIAPGRQRRGGTTAAPGEGAFLGRVILLQCYNLSIIIENRTRSTQNMEKKHAALLLLLAR